MHGLAITNKGIEKIAAQEINELIGATGILGETIVRFDVKDLLDLCVLCYKMQSVGKVMFLLGHVRFATDDEVYAYAKALDFSTFLKKDKTFRVRCVRLGEHSFDSADIEQEIGGMLAETYGCKANLDNPDIPVYVYINNDDCYVGIDFAGFDLSKRQYRIFSPAADQLRATTAYAMLRIAGFTKKTALLDPFCCCGTILIEAALHACNYSVNFYDKDKFAFRRFPCFASVDFDAFFEKLDKQIMLPDTKIVGYDTFLQNVKSAQKNAKIAGINKQIDVSKIDVEWLDTKFGKEELDLIASCPPVMTKIKENMIKKIYKEFFYQAEFVLRKNGKIVLVTATPDAFTPFAKEYAFKEMERLVVEQGKQRLWIVTFVK